MTLIPLRLLLLPIFFAFLISAPPVRAQTSEQVRLFDQMTQRVEERENDLIALRHDIHQHPELSGEEERTAGLVSRWLVDLGFEVRTGIGGHGVVGILKGSRPGPMVAFRADMDAVRSNAEDPVEYRSLIPGIRHICGHDVHTTIGIGLAEGFSVIQEELAGSVMLIFQPAEERGTGANAMLREGTFEIEKPDAIFAVHTTPYQLGDLATVAGGMMAGRASLSVTIKGDKDVSDATSVVRSAIENVGTLAPHLATQNAPKGFILVQLQPGTRAAQSGNGVVINGQVMTAGYEDRARAKKAILAKLDAIDLPGITLETTYDERFMEGVNNDAGLVERSNAGILTLTPEINIHKVEGAVPAFSEDFGSFQVEVPGVMYFLGVSNAETGTVGMPHSPDYVADDASILIGTRTMMAAMLAQLMAE